jgi:hypothetical protein
MSNGASITVEGIDIPHMLHVKTQNPSGEERDLVVVSGTAYFRLQGTGGDFFRKEFTVDIGPVWRRIENVAPMAALTSWRNNGTAVNAGAAVDNCDWARTAIGPAGDTQIRLTALVAVSDIDGIVYRFAFTATAVGILR